MDARRIVAVLAVAGLAAAAILYARRARAASSSSSELPPIGAVDDEVRIRTSQLYIAGVDLPPPDPSPFQRLGANLGAAVDQVKDALKGLGLWSRKVPAKYAELFALAGAQYRLPPGLLEAVAYRESRFREDIITGEFRSSAGAVGIMQIVPRFHPEIGEAGALDPVRAVPYAARFLRELFERFGNWKHALAAYNWGPTALAGALKRGGKWPPETIDYVAEISANAGLA